MPSKNVKDFPAVQSLDITTTNSLLSVVNGELRRLSAGNLSMLSLNATTGVFSNGSVPAAPLLNNPLTVVGSGNSYMQLNIQNRATGTTATADLVITANNGTDSTNFINLGINNVGYNDPAFTNGTGLDGYLFINGGNLDIGTQTRNTQIEFHVGGTTAARTIARIDSSGMNIVSGTFRVNDSGVLLEGRGVFTTTFTHDNTNMNNNTYYFSNLQALDASVNSTQRRMSMMQKCKAKYASWGTYTAVAREQDSTTNPSTGYFVNNTTNMSGIISTQIRHPSNATLAIFTGEITPNIDINFGDRIQLAFRVPNYATGMSGVSNSVDVTFLY